MPAGALTPFTACDAYRYKFCGSGIVNDVTKSRSCTEYLLPTDCIIVLDS